LSIELKENVSVLDSLMWNCVMLRIKKTGTDVAENYRGLLQLISQYLDGWTEQIHDRTQNSWFKAEI